MTRWRVAAEIVSLSSRVVAARRSRNTARMRMGDILLAARAVTSGELARGLERARLVGQRLGSALMALGMLEADQVAAALAALKGVPAARDVDIRHATIAPVLRVPPELARELCALPLALRGDRELVVAMRDPDDLDAVAALTRAAGLAIRPAVASEARLRQALEGPYALRTRVRERVPSTTPPVPGASRRGHVRARLADGTLPPTDARPSGPALSMWAAQPRRAAWTDHLPLELAIAPRRPSVGPGPGAWPTGHPLRRARTESEG
jgi:hypothetical protein